MPAHDQNWSIPTDMLDFMNQSEKRLGNEERRPVVKSPVDLLGPGFAGGPLCTPMTDFNDKNFWFNGMYYAPKGTLNGPNGTVTIDAIDYPYNTTTEGKDCLVLTLAGKRLAGPTHGQSVEELRVTQIVMILNFDVDGMGDDGYIAYRWLRLLSNQADADFHDWKLIKREG